MQTHVPIFAGIERATAATRIAALAVGAELITQLAGRTLVDVGTVLAIGRQFVALVAVANRTCHT